MSVMSVLLTDEAAAMKRATVREQLRQQPCSHDANRLVGAHDDHALLLCERCGLVRLALLYQPRED